MWNKDYKKELTLMEKLIGSINELSPRLDKLFWVLVVLAGESIAFSGSNIFTRTKEGLQPTNQAPIERVLIND